MHIKLPSVIWRPFCLGLHVLILRVPNKQDHSGQTARFINIHYNDVIMGAVASQITSLTIVYSTVYSDTDQRKHQSSASLAFMRGIHRGSVNSRTNGQ